MTLASHAEDWDELIASADKIRAKGYIPLALGGQSWQEIFVFESILIDVGGRDSSPRSPMTLTIRRYAARKC